MAAVMQSTPVTVPPETSVLDAIALMRKERLDYLLVVKDDHLVGIVTETMFCRNHRSSPGTASSRLLLMACKAATTVMDIPRVLGSYGGSAPGPLVICIGGMHGNEPAGVFAMQRVLRSLHETQPAFRGELLTLSGNRAALARRCRYIAQDLNRLWTADRIAAIRRPA